MHFRYQLLRAAQIQIQLFKLEMSIYLLEEYILNRVLQHGNVAFQIKEQDGYGEPCQRNNKGS